MQNAIHSPIRVTETTAPMPLGYIEIEIRSVYGEAKAYPVCERAHRFTRIAGTKTLTGPTLREIERMGFEISSRANADWRGVR